jgi:hypothetical protein
MTYKNIILATLLLPSFISCQTEEDRCHKIIVRMCSLMLRMMSTNHQMTTAMWANGAHNQEFAKEEVDKGFEMYKEAKQLVEEMESITSHE